MKIWYGSQDIVQTRKFHTKANANANTNTDADTNRICTKFNMSPSP